MPGRTSARKPDSTDRRIARIVGDATVDWFLALPDASLPDSAGLAYLWDNRTTPNLAGHAGGAALVRQIVETTLAGEPGEPCVTGSQLNSEALNNPSYTGYVRSYATFRMMERRAGARERVWRMERFLGWHPATTEASEHAGEWGEGVRACLYVEDGNQQFRSNRAMWIDTVEAGAEHIVVRQSGNLGKGELWAELTRRHADRLTFICAVGDLRREGAPIGRPLSWERTAQDIVAALRDRPDISAAKRVVVLLATSGAVIVDRDQPPVLLFDPFHQEGDWERNRPGIGIGAGTCNAASIVAGNTGNPDDPWHAELVRRGLLAARNLFDLGYDTITGQDGVNVTFPLDRVAAILRGDDGADNPIQIAEVRHKSGWRLFETAFAGSFREAAHGIALQGERAAGQEIPIETMGGWSSVDRIEIESMRSVRNIVSEYLATSRKERPLNLAVFGAPGSGKSYAIKQMAHELMSAGSRLSVLEFNLSQFRSIEALPSALQRVRDHAVLQTLPLVFWDEFDSALNGQELGWLVNFLAPMQDGTFIEDGNIRPVGPAIFVFAGGTHSTMDSFRSRAMELPSAKATDFLSRLRGYVNVLGPNPQSDDDRTFPLRRAMLLRTSLRRRAPHFFTGDQLRIDPGILNAYLDVPQYLHGSRSLESIVEMSELHHANRYERYSLPAVHQLALHVDADAFMRIVEQTDRASDKAGPAGRPRKR